MMLSNKTVKNLQEQFSMTTFLYINHNKFTMLCKTAAFRCWTIYHAVQTWPQVD